jgi:excisionase family DNA binding protein
MNYLTISQAAKLKGCTRVTIYKWIEQCKLSVYVVAGRRFVVEDEIFAAAKSGREEERGKIARLEERLANLEEGNEALRKMAEETLAKLSALEKQGKVNSKESVKIKNK